jgi:hypothetical protein
MKPALRHSNRASRRGFVLLAILVFILLLSMVTLSLLFRSQGEELAVNASVGSEQAWAAAMSGVEEAMRVAATAPTGSTDWQDDPATFRQRAVSEAGDNTWYFTVYSPAGPDALVDIRHGLSDEACRLNLNHLRGADITKIPKMTPELAASILQFAGQPSTSSSTNAALTAGSGSNDLSSLPGGPVQPHGPLATIDQLLLVPGVSWPLLHGEISLNTGPVSQPTPEPDESQGHFPPPARSAKTDRGFGQYLTVYSEDSNLNNAGQPRININDPNAAWPAEGLPPGFTNYIAALRTSNQRLDHVSDALEATAKAANHQGVEVDVPSGITKAELPLLLDLFTTERDKSQPGLVNVNTASAAVLACLPGIDSSLAEAIVSARTGLAPERRATIAWLYQEGVVDASKFKAIAPNLTARSSQFEFHVVGYALPSGHYRVLDVVIDVSGGERHVTYLRDITRLGMPFKFEQENPADPNSRDDRTARARNPRHG